jgi:hypothetical protein
VKPVLQSVLAVGVLCGSTTLFAQIEGTVSSLPTKLDRATLDLHDGFEGDELGPLWIRMKMEPDSATPEYKIVRAGKQSLAITVRSHDGFEKGRSNDADSERDEITEAPSLVAREGEAFEYSFSIFFPKNFPVVPTRLVVAQWKQYCPETQERCSDHSPVLAVRYVDGELSVTQDLEAGVRVLWSKRAEFRGRWLDFRVRIRFLPEEHGRILVWLGDKSIVDVRGRTAYVAKPESGYPAVGHFYFKMGLYRNVMPQPMTAYFDEYRKRALSTDEF